LRLCQGVEVGRSSFYAWIAGADARAQRQADDDALAERIKRVHHADRAYGAPRITAELNDPASPDNAPAVGDAPSADVPAGDGDRSPGQGRLLEPVNHKRVARVMRERRIVGSVFAARSARRSLTLTARRWRNARTEGCNRVIKQIKRVACGFRNQNNYERRRRRARSGRSPRP